MTAVKNLWARQNAGNFLTTWKPVNFSTRTLLHGVFASSYFTLLVIITNSNYIFYLILFYFFWFFMKYCSICFNPYPTNVENRVSS